MIDFPSASSPSELKFELFKRKGNIEEEENKYNKNSCCTSPDKVRFYLRNDDDLFYKDRTTSIAKKNNLILRLTMNVITNFGYKTVRQKRFGSSQQSLNVTDFGFLGRGLAFGLELSRSVSAVTSSNDAFGAENLLALRRSTSLSDATRLCNVNVVFGMFYFCCKNAE